MNARIVRAAAIGMAMAVAVLSCGGDDSPTEPTDVCTLAIAPGSLSFGAEGGTGQVSVTTQAGCTWSAAANAGWITITGSTTGTGSATVAYSVPANPAAESRTGTLTIGGQNHGITQQGRTPTACTHEITPSRADFSKDAATGTFAVTAPAGCAWTAESRVSWVAITSGAQGSGTGSVSYSVTRNTESAARAGTITVADRLFTINQAGDAGLCQYSVEPTQFRPCMPAGTLTAAVTTQAGCSWTVTSSEPWLAITGGESRSGAGVITVTFTENYDAPREGLIRLRWPTPTAGQNVLVAQAGCVYGVSRTEMSFTAAGGSGSFDVLQQSEPATCGGATQDRCVWSARSDVPWIAISGSMPRVGDAPVAFTVTPNVSTASRVGRIVVRNKVVVVTQAGAAAIAQK